MERLSNIVASIESLECRRLFATIALSGSTLRIIGDDTGVGPDDGDDEILITRNDSGTDRYVVRVNGEVQTFRVSRVNTIRISTHGGDDEIEISNESGTISARRFVTAGNGNDRIFSTGGGGETLRGSSGNDIIRASDGSDIIEGNGGRDSLFGESGRDQIFGGRGNDSISGGTNDDMLYGDAGNDDIFGDTGNDTLAGDSEDALELDGGPAVPAANGNDELNGGADADTLLAHTGRDSLTGAGGTDLFDPRDDNDEDSITDRAAGEVVASEEVFNGVAFGNRTITLRIVIDGDDVVIPAGAGELPGGNSFATAIDGNGTIRFSDLTDRTFRLGEFFQAWGFTFDQNHIGRFQEDSNLQLRMTVNGNSNTQFEDYVIRNGNEIVITMS